MNKKIPLTFNNILTDIICTEKSYDQEANLSQFCLISSAKFTQVELKQALLRLMPDLEITKICCSRILKRQQSKATCRRAGYYFKLGSNRSSLNGEKKYNVTIKNPEVIVKYFNI